MCCFLIANLSHRGVYKIGEGEAGVPFCSAASALRLIFLFQWLKQVSAIRKSHPFLVEGAAAADASDGSHATGSAVADDGIRVQPDVADDIESVWYYENVGFYDRGRVSDYAISGCCWIDSSTIAATDYNGGVHVLSSSNHVGSFPASQVSSQAFERVIATWQHSSSARGVVSLSPSNLLSVGSDCNVRLFDMIEGRVVSSVTMAQRLSSAFFEKTLQHVAVGCSSGALLLLDPHSLQLVQTFTGHSSELTCVASHSAFGSPLLLTSSFDATVRLWDARSGTKSCHVLHMQRGTAAPLYSVISCDGFIAAGDEDGELTAWKGSDFIPVESLYNNNGSPTPCFLASDASGTLFSSAAAVSNHQGKSGCVLVRQGLAQTPAYAVGDGQLGEISCLSVRDDGYAFQSSQADVLINECLSVSIIMMLRLLFCADA
jgi:WD40 repeat protein